MVIRLVEDKEHVEKIKKALKDNNGYCPCVPDFIRTEKHKCICEDFREKMEIGEPCKCHCGLYEIVK